MHEDAFLASLRDEPDDELTWQALADFLDDNGQGARAELLRLTRQMLPTPVGERGDVPRRYVELLGAGVKPVVVEWANSIGMRFALVPPGRFLMGSPPDEAGRNEGEQLHEVTLTKAFYLGIHPVTQKQWKAVMGNNPSWFCASGSGKDKVAGMDTDDFPVEQVSWEDAQEFLKNLAAMEKEMKHRREYRLPSEAEWEYSCRGGGEVKHPFSFARPTSSLSSTQANFDGKRPYGGADEGPDLQRPCKVGSYDANPFGLYDLHGNVWEWCADWYGAFEAAPVTDPLGSSEGLSRVFRGGGWNGYGRDCRAAFRSRTSPGYRFYDIGFRAALVLSE